MSLIYWPGPLLFIYIFFSRTKSALGEPSLVFVVVVLYYWLGIRQVLLFLVLFFFYLVTIPLNVWSCRTADIFFAGKTPNLFLLPSTARFSNDNHEPQVESTSSTNSVPTPTGAQSPRAAPPVDRRVPDILHSIFGQVCEAPGPGLPSASVSGSASPPAPEILPVKSPHAMKEEQMEASTEPLNQVANKEGKEGDGEKKTQDTISEAPPKTSSSQTTVNRDDENPSSMPVGVSGEQKNPPVDHRDRNETPMGISDRPIATLCRAFKNVFSRNFPFTAKPAHDFSPEHDSKSQHSRHPSLSRPAPGPTSESDSASPSSPKFPLFSHLDSVYTHPSASLNAEENTQKLTHSKHKSSSPSLSREMANESSSKQESTSNMIKNTTPSVSDRSSVSNGNQPSNATHDRSTAQSSVSENSADRQSIPVTSVKGELVVTILEGRDLRPSYEPYIISVFELNEDISHGAERSRDDPEAEAASAAQSLLWNTSDAQPSEKIAIQGPTNPLRIPASSTARSSRPTPKAKAEDGKKDARMTDPQWNHRVVLYVDDP